MRFGVVTLGCKVNQYESQTIAAVLISRGHIRVKPGEGCDVCIINTCAVTAESVRKSRQAVRRLKKKEPGALIAVCGCFSQLEPETAVKLGADVVGGSGDRERFTLEVERNFEIGPAKHFENKQVKSAVMPKSASEYVVFENIPIADLHSPISISNLDFDNDANVSEVETGLRDVLADISSAEADPSGINNAVQSLPALMGRTRALLKIQDGCNNYCAYCVIPFARGRSRSMPLEMVSQHSRQFETAGYKEIVVTGIEISSYGKDLEGVGITLMDAIRATSIAAPEARIRIGSLDPKMVSNELVNGLFEIPGLCPHFHLSLQSGCDDTLRRMGRRYDTSHVLNVITDLRRVFPDCFIAADLIVGFPGENDEEFRRTMDFINEVAFSAMHIFPFSPRPGTRAAEMPGQVNKQQRHERAGVAAQLAEAMSLSFRQNQIAKTADVIFEQKINGFWSGYSGNYLEIRAANGGARNMRCKMRIKSIEDNVIWGDILSID